MFQVSGCRRNDSSLCDIVDCKNYGWDFWFLEVICGAILNKNGHEVVGMAKSLVSCCSRLNVFQSFHTSSASHTSKCGNEKPETVLTVETNLLA